VPTPRPPVGRSEEVRAEGISYQEHQDGVRLVVLARRVNVQVIQRHAHLAGGVKLEFVNGREGKIAKAVLTAISNTRHGSGDSREEESTAIQWTLWGKLAENAAEYLGKGSHVNIVGRLRNNNYEKDGEEVYPLAFTTEEVDYLDSRAESEARRARVTGPDRKANGSASAGSESSASASTPNRNCKPHTVRQPAHPDA
jgi:single-strand DNA-binding protein